MENFEGGFGVKRRIVSRLPTVPMEWEAMTNDVDLNVVVREVVDEGDTYYVAECIEIPGCVSDGATAEEAKKNIQNAMELCVGVILEDAIRELTRQRPLPDLRNIVKAGPYACALDV